jgi:phosphocarrier protein
MTTLKGKIEEPDSDHFCEKKFVVRNKLGLHARPAAMFVQLANKFQSEISIRKGKQRVNGKSIMGLMTLAAGPGSQVVISTQGLDAKKAMAGIEKLFETNFGE